MKLVKRLLPLAILLVLVLSLGAPAFAAEAQYKSTQEFLDQIATVEGFTWKVNGIVPAGNGARYEAVELEYAGGALSPYLSRFTLLFAEGNDQVTLDMFNIVKFAEADLPNVLLAVNDLNAGGAGVKFYVDLNDFTVTAEMYQLATPETCADFAVMSVGFLITYTDSAYDNTLAPFETAA